MKKSRGDSCYSGCWGKCSRGHRRGVGKTCSEVWVLIKLTPQCLIFFFRAVSFSFLSLFWLSALKHCPPWSADTDRLLYFHCCSWYTLAHNVHYISRLSLCWFLHFDMLMWFVCRSTTPILSFLYFLYHGWETNLNFLDVA